MAMVAPVAARAGAGKAAARKASTSKAATGKAGGRARGGATGSAAAPAGGTPPTPQQTSQQANDLLGRTSPAKVAKAGRNVTGSLGDATRQLTLTPPRRISAKDASGFAFGLVAYAVALAGIKYGPPGVRGWIAAKFLNKPMDRPDGRKYGGGRQR